MTRRPSTQRRGDEASQPPRRNGGRGRRGIPPGPRLGNRRPRDPPTRPFGSSATGPLGRRPGHPAAPEIPAAARRGPIDDADCGDLETRDTYDPDHPETGRRGLSARAAIRSVWSRKPPCRPANTKGWRRARRRCPAGRIGGSPETAPVRIDPATHTSTPHPRHLGCAHEASGRGSGLSPDLRAGLRPPAQRVGASSSTGTAKGSKFHVNPCGQLGSTDAARTQPVRLRVILCFM